MPRTFTRGNCRAQRFVLVAPIEFAVASETQRCVLSLHKIKTQLVLEFYLTALRESRIERLVLALGCVSGSGFEEGDMNHGWLT